MNFSVTISGCKPLSIVISKYRLSIVSGNFLKNLGTKFKNIGKFLMWLLPCMFLLKILFLNLSLLLIEMNGICFKY